MNAIYVTFHKQSNACKNNKNKIKTFTLFVYPKKAYNKINVFWWRMTKKYFM